MNEEIEALYALLGVKPDEASVSDSVDKLVKAVQSKLKSSIYGGKDGVITLPATIDGKFKNGKEINQEIKDAYAAIYKKAQQMADESVSLTLNDIKDFKAQIDKFGRKTAKYKSNDVIANANNNLRQMLSDYQDYVNELRIEVSKIQKVQIKQTQKAKAQQKAKTQQKGETAYDDYLNKQEKYSRQAQGAKERKELFQELDEVRENKSPVKSSGNIRASSTNDYLMRLSEYSAHGSRWANELARTLKEEIAKSAKTLVTYIDPSYKKRTENGRATTEREFLNDTIKAAKKQLKNSIAQLEAGSEDITLDTLKEQAAVIKVLNKALGRTTEQAEKIITSAIENRYNGSTEVTQGKGKYKYDKTTQTKVGGTNLEEGQIKGAGPGHDNTQKLVKELYTAMHQWDAEVVADTIAKEIILGNEKTINKIENNRKRKSTTSQSDNEIMNVKTTPDYKTELAQLNGRTNEVFDAVIQTNKLTNEQTTYDKNANVKSDTDMAKEIKVEEVNRDINKDTARAVKADEVSGFNTDTLANKLIGVVEDIRNNLGKAKEITSKIELPASTKDLYNKLASPKELLGLPKPDGRRKKISDGLKDENPQLGLIPIQNAMKKALAVIPGEFTKTLKEAIHPSVLDKQRHIDRPEGADKFEYNEDMLRRLANASNARKEARRNQNGDNITPPRVVIPDYQPQVEKSKIYASPIKQTVWDKLADALGDLTGATKAYKDVINAVAEDQDKMAAERIIQYGMNNGRNPNDTGDIAGMRRILQLYRTNKASIEQNPELRQKIRLTGGRDVDTTAITKALNKTLSGKQMRNAQMGGSPLRQVAGAFTGFIGMPSIEKSRAQADGLNQILGNINNALNSVLANIQMKETELAGLEKEGKARFNADGTLTEDSSSAAFKTLADLEEEKLVLDTIKADLLANDEIIARTGGKFSKLVKQLSFTSPVLRDNNSILRNINAGLDKNGKALKFQTRMAEILNYTFQLISRSIGQWFKRMISMLNPLNIIKNTFKTITGWIKSAFQDFGSYDVKWQRTMNVIKINFQRAIKPAMEWIAQKLVNIIGFFNIISMKIQEAFGQVPVDLFDQAGANAEKMRRELEEAANVTAGFDELHDIGSDNSGANDLFGDIYKPQLSQEWIDLANKIGDLFAGLIKGDLGFGKVMAKIFDILLKGLGAIAKAIWDWFRQTSFGKWITENWQHLLWALLNIFIAWKLFKILGPMLLNAFTGWATEGVFKGLLSKIGGWIIGGFKSLFTSGGMIGTITSGATSLGTIFGQALLAVTGGVIAGTGGKIAADMIANDTDYNYGLMSAGGKERDKKSSTGAYATSAITGAIGGGITGFAIGGPVGAAIGATLGAIANIVNTSLVPGFREWSIKIKDATNELQSLSYYEGRLQAATSEVNQYTEMVNLFTGSIKTQTDSIYKQGEQLGIAKSRMDFLIESVQNGTFYTGMLSGSEEQLAGSLGRLATMTEKTEEASNKLTEAKKKQAKAETTLAIAQDISAGNLELAAARVEVAYASEVYTVDEATKQMSQIIKKGSDEQKLAMLEDMSPDIQANFKKYTTTTEEGVNDICEIFYNMNEEAQKAFAKDYAEEAKYAMQRTLQALQQTINDSNIFNGMKSSIARIQKELIIKNAKAQGIDLAHLDVGTNYVPNDGLAYLHQGEAVIPKKYNQPYQPQDTSAMSSAIDRLVQQVASISSKVEQGIPVKGQFVQRGSDLVATVEKANNRMKNNVLNNKVYAR